MRNGLRSLVDWVSVTFKRFTSVYEVIEILGIPAGDFKDMPRGLHGYSKQKACGDIRVLYEGSEGMGIHVQMSGQGCREFETYYNDGWIEFFKVCVENAAQFTRIDTAVDDIRYNRDKPYFTVRQLIRKVKRDECKSIFRTLKRIESIEINGGKTKGQTVYIGSDRSDIQVIIYEKNHERESAGVHLEENLTTWNRLELRMRNDRAQLAIFHLLQGKLLGELIIGVLANYIDFVDRTNDSNKARWPRSKFWDKFLGDVEKLKLTLVAPDKTIEQNKAWLDHQVSPSLAMQFLANNSDLQWLYDMLNAGLERLTEAQIEKAEEYLKYMTEENQKYFKGLMSAIRHDVIEEKKKVASK